MSKNAVYFIAGATVGALGAWFFAKKKYEKIAQEEIQSVTDAFSERLDKFARSSVNDPSVRPTPEDLEKEATKPGDRNIIDYAAVLAKQGYTDYTKFSKDEEESAAESEPEDISENTSDGPVIICPDDYGEIPNYEQLSWIYFADHILTDDDYSLITNYEKWIGAGALQHFGEYEDDAIHVRNDKLKCYIEVVIDSRLYASVVAEKNSY